jgi:hypothetical protein
MTLEAPTADFDRSRSQMAGLPGVKFTMARTILDVYPMLHEKNVTFVIETARKQVPGDNDSGFTIFLQIVDAQGSRRVVIPPKAAAIIYRQRQSLTDRSTPESRKRAAARRQREKQRKEREARRAKYRARNGQSPQ